MDGHTPLQVEKGLGIKGLWVPTDNQSPFPTDIQRTPPGKMNATEALVSLYNATAGVTTSFGRAFEMLAKSQLYGHFEEAIYFAFKVIVVYQAVNQRFNLRFPECFRKWIPGDVRMRVESTDPIYGALKSFFLEKRLLILSTP